MKKQTGGAGSASLIGAALASLRKGRDKGETWTRRESSGHGKFRYSKRRSPQLHERALALTTEIFVNASAAAGAFGVRGKSQDG